MNEVVIPRIDFLKRKVKVDMKEEGGERKVRVVGEEAKSSSNTSIKAEAKHQCNGGGCTKPYEPP